MGSQQGKHLARGEWLWRLRADYNMSDIVIAVYLTIIGWGFCDIQNIEGRGSGYQPKPKTEADKPYRDLDYSGYLKNPNLIIVLLYIEGKKMVTIVSGTDHLFLKL